MEEQQNLPTKKRRNGSLPSIIATVIVIVTVSSIVIYNLPANRRDRQLALAEKYMSELNYEAAILAYKAAIEIDPKCEDAYIELVNLYVATEAYDEALTLINNAESLLESDALNDKSEQLQVLLSTNNYTEESIGYNGWSITDNNTYYYIDGVMQKGLITIDGDDYYFDDSTGVLQIDTTIEIDNIKYTCSNDGKLQIIKEKHVVWYIWYGNDIYGNLTSWVELRNKYDSFGHVVSTTYYEQDGTQKETINYEYDDEGKTTTEIAFDVNGNVIRAYEYDRNNNFVTVRNSITGNIKNEIEYDDNGQMVEYISYSYDSTQQELLFEEHTYYSHEADKDISNFVQYDSNGTLLDSRVYETYYNSNKVKTKEISYHNDNLSFWREFIYDENNNLIKINEYNENNVLNSSSENFYDDNGNIVKTISYSGDGTKDFECIKTYDEENNETSRTGYRKDGSISYYMEWHYE